MKNDMKTDMNICGCRTAAEIENIDYCEKLITEKEQLDIRQVRVKNRPGSGILQFVITTSAGKSLGMVEKFKNDKHTKHPWRAFRGIGAAATFVGAFYTEDGGREAAVNAVVL